MEVLAVRPWRGLESRVWDREPGATSEQRGSVSVYPLDWVGV